MLGDIGILRHAPHHPMFIDMAFLRGWERSAVPGYSEPTMGSSAKARTQPRPGPSMMSAISASWQEPSWQWSSWPVPS